MVMGEGRSATPNRPKVDVSWVEAVDFCQRLSELAGAPPAYEGRGSDRTSRIIEAELLPAVAGLPRRIERKA